jgi:hypothetical protein
VLITSLPGPAPAAAGWDPEEHPRGWHGRFGHGLGPGQAETGSLRHDFSGDEARRHAAGKVAELAGAASRNDWQDEVRYLERAVLALELEHDTAKAVAALRTAARNAGKKLAGHDRAVAYGAIADGLRGLPPSPEAVTAQHLKAFVAAAAPAVPKLLGGGREAWNGHVSVFSPEERPGIAGSMGWDGTMRVEGRVAAGLDDTLSHLGAQVDDPDNFNVVLHELTHAELGGRSTALLEEYNALPEQDRKTLATFARFDAERSPSGDPIMHELAALLPNVSQAEADSLTARGLLAKSDFTSQHWDLGRPSGRVYSWGLTARGHDLAASAPETYAQHEAEYPGVKAIEEGTTELGTAQHAEEFFNRLGLGGRPTPFTADPGTVPSVKAILAEQDEIRALDKLAGQQGGPGSMGTYTLIHDAEGELWHPEMDRAKIARDLLGAAQTTNPELSGRLHALTARLGLTTTNPAWEKARAELETALRAEQRKLGADDGAPQQQAARHLGVVIRDVQQGMLVEDLIPGDLAEVLGEIQHLGDPDTAADAKALRGKLDTLTRTPVARHATMAEYARRLADPARIASGQSWGHYPDWAAQSQAFFQAVAAAERRRNLGKIGSAGYRRVVALTDEVNREAIAAKLPVMARQVIAAAHGGDPDGWTSGEIRQVEQAITGKWLEGGAGAFAAAKAVVARLHPAVKAAQDGPEEEPLPVTATLTPAGERARRIAEAAFTDPARLAQAAALVDELARRVADDPAGLRQVQDAGRMLARLTPGQGGPDVAAAGWDPLVHPRDEHGRFTRRGPLQKGHKTPPRLMRARRRTAAADIRADDWVAGFKVTRAEPGNRPGATRLHLDRGGMIILGPAWRGTVYRDQRGRLEGGSWHFQATPRPGDRLIEHVGGSDAGAGVANVAMVGDRGWAGIVFDDGRFQIVEVNGGRGTVVDGWQTPDDAQLRAWSRLRWGIGPYPPGERPGKKPRRKVNPPGTPPAGAPAGHVEPEAAKVRTSLGKAVRSDHEQDKIPGDDTPITEGAGYNYFGNTADTSIVTFADGSKWVRKRLISDRAIATEIAYSRVANALGVPAPMVVKGPRRQDGEGEMYEPYVDGATAIEWTGGYDPDFEPDPEEPGDYDVPTEPVDGHDPAEMYRSPEGRMIGLVDTITGAGDRHLGNWMVRSDADGDHPVPIDNEDSGFYVGGYAETPFARFLDYGKLAAEHTQADWDRWEAELAALRPEFGDIGMDEEYAHMLDNFAAERAKTEAAR